MSSPLDPRYTIKMPKAIRVFYSFKPLRPMNDLFIHSWSEKLGRGLIEYRNYITQWSRYANLYLTCNDRWVVVPGFLSSKNLTLRKKSCRLTRRRVFWSSFACVGSLRSEKKTISWSSWMDLRFYWRSYLVCKCTVSCMAGQTVTRFFATMEELLDLFERPVCCQEHCRFVDLGRNMTFLH